MGKRKTEESDSSSSEDETIRMALAEATDPLFLKEALFSQKDFNILKDTITVETPKSLRKNLDTFNDFHNFGVSENFKQFVAKKLNEMLEKNIRLKNQQLIENDNNYASVAEKGIKLLSNSYKFLDVKVEEELIKQDKIVECHRKSNKYDESKILQKCKEVAVSPDWILSKEATKGWTNRRKNIDFKYKKLKNGTLAEIK
ncbi:uncharacterized protein [Prorops nasuta]|uniref:uncharacterized protein n=1 Tax=Prorops nasuta TaxID=863751 RepID=UPI0034CE238C